MTRHEMDSVEHTMARAQIERSENWRQIITEIPALKFKPSWEVQVIPPFAGAVARFWVKKGDASVSVYLDWFGRLGIMDDPYYEAYPGIDGDVNRYGLDETEQMIADIEKTLNASNRRRKAQKATTES